MFFQGHQAEIEQHKNPTGNSIRETVRRNLSEDVEEEDGGRVQNDQVDIKDNFRPLPAGVGILAGRRRRRLGGRGKLGKRGGTENCRSAEQEKE